MVRPCPPCSSSSCDNVVKKISKLGISETTSNSNAPKEPYIDEAEHGPPELDWGDDPMDTDLPEKTLEDGEVEDSVLTVSPSDTSVDSEIKNCKRHREEEEEVFFVVDKKGRFEFESSPPPRAPSKSKKSDDYDTKKRNTRHYIANMVVKIITEKTTAVLDDTFVADVKETVLDCLLAQNRKLEYYEDLKEMRPYKLAGTVSDLLEKYHRCGPLIDDERSVLVNLLDSVQKSYTVGLDNLRKSGLCATHRPFSFAKWTDDNGDLHLREHRVLGHAVTDPLGAAFDGEKGFLFTGNNEEIMRCDEDGKDYEVLVKSAKKPSAIAIIKCGERFAYLDLRGIHIFDFITKTSTNIATELGGSARGLVYLPSGHLVTAVRSRNGTRICAYDVNKRNKLVSISTYTEGSTPSFMTSIDTTIYMNNLDEKVMDVYKMDKGALKHLKTISLTSKLTKECKFPSGIVADSRKEVIFCDARHGDGFLLWGAATLDDWKVVKTNGPFPYSAAIAISPGGTLLAACRQSHSIRLFQFEK